MILNSGHGSASWRPPIDPRLEAAHALLLRGELAAAAAIYRDLVVEGCAEPAGYSNLAAICLRLDQPEEALVYIEAALALEPRYPEAWFNRGLACQQLGRLEEAIRAYRRALRWRALYPDALCNLGNALQDRGAFRAARRCYRRALRIQPDHAEAGANLALLQLLLGSYRDGWAHYHWRERTATASHGPTVVPDLPRCHALADLESAAGREGLLLVCEQGLGDTVQFMRYLKPLQERGVSIRLCAQPALQGLIASNSAGVALCSVEEAQELRDGVWMPLLSLPGLLGVRPEHPLVTAPYIRAEPERVQGWRRRLGEAGGPVVALHWQGNPAAETRNLRGRSLPLASLAPLAAVDVRLLSVQKGAGSEQLECCPFRERFVAAQEEVEGIWDFEETAAIVASTDLLITTDSAVAHLAGAMGHPTWLLLQKTPDWRWGLTGHSTFWYPSVRLFRQRERGHWGEVIERVARRLAHQRATSSLTAGRRGRGRVPV